MTTILFVAENNCMSSSIFGAVDSYSIANLLWQFMNPGDSTPLFETRIVSLDGKPVVGNAGVVVTPQASMEETRQANIIIIPAFFIPIDYQSNRIQGICDWLRRMYADGCRLAATCTGSFLLAYTGLLDGRQATTNWQYAQLFRRMYPEVRLRIDRILTEEDGLYCTGAATAFMNLCLHFIEKWGSADLARQCAKSLLVDPDRTKQSPYMIYDFWKNHSDSEILESQKWMEENYTNKLSIDTIAEQVGISPRHFKRRFKKATGEPPLAYLQLLRIENAKRKLEATRDTVNEITWQVGYEDINSFRRLFKKHTGMSPKEYRKKFSWSPTIGI